MTPSIKRRMACMLYESMLLFSVVFLGGWLFDTLTDSRHALKLRHARQAWLFLVIGVYFTFFWYRSGQTLAMKTWRIRLVSASGASVPIRIALLRYLLAWMWFLPAVAIDYAFALKGWTSIAVIGFGMLAWLLTSRLDPHRQFLHDRLAGTRLVDTPKAVRALS